MSSKRQQTMAKMTRERTVRERRARKLEKKQAARAEKKAKAEGESPEERLAVTDGVVSVEHGRATPTS